jgi:hypothetical protein
MYSARVGALVLHNRSRTGKTAHRERPAAADTIGFLPLKITFITTSSAPIWHHSGQFPISVVGDVADSGTELK